MKKLYIDGNNTFIRHYVVNPAMNRDGYPVGGIFGFLRDIGNLMNMMSPDEVVVVWDGEGGSARKKIIMKEYKEGRKPVYANSLNREYDLDPESAIENKFYQMDKLIEYLEYTPIKQIQVPAVEADDILAYLAQRDARAGHKCIIVSMDKDFLQVINKNIAIYKPVQKVLYTMNTMLEKYKIYPRNFALYRSMLGKGDSSDNIKGINGIGEKTFLKWFPMFTEDRDIPVEEVIEYSKENKKKSTKYQRCIIGEDIIRRNYQIAQLYSPILNSNQILEIEAQLDDNDGNLQHHKLMMLFNKDGFTFLDGLDRTFEMLRSISVNY